LRAAFEDELKASLSIMMKVAFVELALVVNDDLGAALENVWHIR
jgi:hypothetical protein